MNKPFKVAPAAGSVLSPGIGPAANLRTPYVRIAGEAFDADQITPNCDECGRDEYGCECELPDWPNLTDFPGGAKLTLEEVHDRIARVFMGVAK